MARRMSASSSTTRIRSRAEDLLMPASYPRGMLATTTPARTTWATQLATPSGVLVAGLLSGTSCDGVDVVLCRVRLAPDGADLLPPELVASQTVAYEDLPKLYAANTFYLQLSMWEGFPSAPCEAMLSGCVPVVSSVAALPEIVGDTGLVLEHKDADELERIIRKALTLDTEAMGRRARERIMQRWPREHRMQFLQLVQRLAKQE